MFTLSFLPFLLIYFLIIFYSILKESTTSQEILPYAGVLKNDSPSPVKKPKFKVAVTPSPAKKANFKVAVTSSAERIPKLTQAAIRIKKVIHNSAAIQVQEDKKSSIYDCSIYFLILIFLYEND